MRIKERYSRRFICQCLGRYSLRVYADTSKVCFFKAQNIGICAVLYASTSSAVTRERSFGFEVALTGEFIRRDFSMIIPKPKFLRTPNAVPCCYANNANQQQYLSQYTTLFLIALILLLLLLLHPLPLHRPDLLRTLSIPNTLFPIRPPPEHNRSPLPLHLLLNHALIQ